MRKLVLAVAAAVVAVALWWRKNPSACPYNQRFWVEAPHPLITRARLREALAPQPGERILEVGPGTGYYSLPVAEWLGPDGTLEILDLQQEMLDHTSGRAREAGLGNVVATQGDARSLPYGDDAFDGAFLVTVLGEVPDQEAALRELGRVVRPGGRVVVGELFGDPHWVSPTRLRARAEAAGLLFARRSGSALGYFARFERRS
jgi:ubiquinone/menaquinone biosynthesis C-methylase UbiE